MEPRWSWRPNGPRVGIMSTPMPGRTESLGDGGGWLGGGHGGVGVGVARDLDVFGDDDLVQENLSARPEMHFQNIIGVPDGPLRADYFYCAICADENVPVICALIGLLQEFNGICGVAGKGGKIAPPLATTI